MGGEEGESMEIVKATVWLYQLALARTVQLIRKNWAVLFAPLAYSVILSVASAMVAPLGFLGGMLLLLVGDACISSGLYLIENLLKMGKTDLNDFLKGWTVYLLDIIQISFILWIPMTLAAQVLYPLPNGLLILLFLRILIYTVFNVVPELLYQARLGGLEVLSASYSFVIENWIEWFVPNLFIGVAAYLALGPLALLATFLPAGGQFFFIVAVASFFLSFFMVFRGALFSLLRGTSRRSRIYKYKMGEPFQGNNW